MTKVEKIQEPLVSIVVITYNSAQFVKETLESIYNQTYQKIELIISDDGSQDDSVKICKEWVKKHKYRFIRTKVVTIEENTGIPANCNRGLKNTSCDWVKIIAGDDALMAECIKDNIDHVQNNPEMNVLLSSVEKYNEVFNEENFISRIPTSTSLDFYNEHINADEQYNLLLSMDRVMTTPTNFIRKKVILEVGYYDERFRLIEDYPMWLKLTKAGHKLNFMDKVTVKHRVHANSTNNIINVYILKPAYFRNEVLRKELVYPNIHKFDALRQRIIFYYSVMLNSLGLNRRTKINFFIFEIFTKFLNPFAYLLYLKKRIK